MAVATATSPRCWDFYQPRVGFPEMAQILSTLLQLDSCQQCNYELPWHQMCSVTMCNLLGASGCPELPDHPGSIREPLGMLGGHGAAKYTTSHRQMQVSYTRPPAVTENSQKLPWFPIVPTATMVSYIDMAHRSFGERGRCLGTSRNPSISIHTKK